MRLVIVESPYAPRTPPIVDRCMHSPTCAELRAGGNLASADCMICAQTKAREVLRAVELDRHIAYARAAVRDCLDRGEAPYASHLLYTQAGILDDTNADERARGIQAGFAWRHAAHATVVYADLGITQGMRIGIDDARGRGLPVEFRSLSGWQSEPLGPPVLVKCPSCSGCGSHYTDNGRDGWPCDTCSGTGKVRAA